MTRLAEYLVAAESNGSAASIEQFGAQTVAGEAADIAAGPLAPLLAHALAELASTGDPEWWTAADSFINGLTDQQSLLALMSSVEAILASPAAVDARGIHLHDVLLRDLVPLIQSHPQLAASRLEGALRLAVAGAVTPFGVLGHLTSLPSGAPEEFTERLPRLLGAAIDRWANETTIVAPLQSALDQLRHDDAAGIDAMFELALCQLREALSAETIPQATQALTAARSSFATVDAAEEARHDARVYAAACDAILAFAANDRDRLVDATDRLTAAVDQRTAWLSGVHSPSWLEPRRAAELVWQRLVLQLRAAAERLSEPAWMDVWDALATVLDAYTQARTVRPLPAVEGTPGLAAIVEPTIEDAILREQGLLAGLRRSIIEVSKLDSPPLDADTARLVLTRIEAASARQREPHGHSTRSTHDEDDEEPHEPDATRLHRLAPALIHGLGERRAANIAADISDNDLRLLEGLVYHRTTAQSFIAHPILDPLYEDLLQQLDTSPNFVGDVRRTFGLLLEQTLRFLLSRADITTKTWGLHKGKDKDYRRLLKKNEQRPFEVDLQQDYYQWLAQGQLAGLVAVEQTDIATGRADVIVTSGATRYLTEIKRELTDASRENLEDSYLRQAADYSNTNVPFGQLLVLDLTPHPDGVRRVDEAVWLAYHRPPNATIDRAVIVGVVAGNRPTPSGLSR